MAKDWEDLAKEKMKISWEYISKRSLRKIEFIEKIDVLVW